VNAQRTNTCNDSAIKTNLQKVITTQIGPIPEAQEEKWFPE
jgi:hypothetical protein